MDQMHSENSSNALHTDRHSLFVKRFAEIEGDFLYYATEHFRLSGVYWGLSALWLIRQERLLDEDKLVSWVLACKHDNGGFAGSVRQDPHLLYTLSAIQVLAMYDRLDAVDAETTASYVSSLQQEDGSFMGDRWGEIDTRYSYCALACCSLLGRLNVLDVTKAAEFVAHCKNFDGGFGVTPGDESHAGQVFACVAALSIANRLELLSPDQLCWWLSERQTPGGGLNGRPEKLEDILDRLHWIDKDALTTFILSCQDKLNGGISDRADDECDVYHTFFGIAGLSILGYPGLEPIDPVYALPTVVTKRCLNIA